MVKLERRRLERLLSRLGITSSGGDVLLGPAYGEDAAVIRIGCGRALITHSDPISGALRNLGLLSIHVSANDVAVTGAEPRYFLITILIPSSWDVDTVLEEVVSGASEALREIGGSIVGGHTEVTDLVRRPVTVTTAFGIITENNVIKTSGAKPGDVVIMTKEAGIEGASILATDFADALRAAGVSERVIQEVAGKVRLVSVVKEALALVREGVVNSMHDPTEGGIVAGLTEIAYASKTSIVAYANKVPVSRSTAEVTRALGIDPLKMLSSGSLLATVPEEGVSRALKALDRAGVPATIIGKVTGRRDYLLKLVRDGGVEEIFKEPYWRDEVMDLWVRIKQR